MKNKIVAVSLDEKRLKIWNSLPPGSRSAFVRVALDDMNGILTWFFLKQRNPEEFFEIDRTNDYTKEKIRQFNEWVEENESVPPFLRESAED